MALNKAAQTAYKVATRLTPDIKSSYKALRAAESAASALDLPDPRCRIESIAVEAPDGYRIPCRVFTPRDIEFSLRDGFTATDDFRGTVLFFHGGGWVNGDVDLWSCTCPWLTCSVWRAPGTWASPRRWPAV